MRFKLGSRVLHISGSGIHTVGIVTDVDSTKWGNEYPIEVVFDNYPTASFTRSGIQFNSEGKKGGYIQLLVDPIDYALSL